MFALILLLLLPFAAAWHGWVLSTLWSWFIMHAFASAPPLSTPEAYGIMLIVSLFTAGISRTKTETIEEKFVYLFLVFFGPAFSLLIGFIVKEVWL